MTFDRRTHWLALITLAAVGSALWAFVDTTAPADRDDGGVIDVTEARDTGPGSLREAIFRAATAPERVRIRLLTSVSVVSPLPPLTNPNGVVIGCAREARPCTLDGSAVRLGPAVDVHAPNSRLEDVSIVGTPGVALLVRSSNVTLQRMRFEDNAVGVQLADGITGIVVSATEFIGNGSGIRLEGVATRVVVRDTAFHRHSVSGIWAVAPRQVPGYAGDALVLHGNRFVDNQIGALAIHLPALFEGNVISESADMGVFLGGARNTLTDNRVTATGTTGIFGSDVRMSRIERNEIADNPSIGLLVRGGGSNHVANNRVYRNGFGIAVVASEASEPSTFIDNLVFSQTQDALWLFTDRLPLLRGNRVVNNRGVAFRLVSSLPDSGPGTSPPSANEVQQLLLANHLDQNGASLARDIYRDEGASR